MSTTRRHFLGATSAAVAGMALGLKTRPLSAAEVRSRAPVAAVFPNRIDPETMRRVAKTAVDAATAAGASFADVRIAERRLFNMYLSVIAAGNMGFDYSYGLRVYVNGVWGTGYGIDPSPESVAATARALVATVKSIPPAVRGNAAPPMPTPAVTGEWHTPMQIDPFDVPVDEHVGIMAAHERALKHKMGVQANINISWRAETRVVASSDGTLATQTFMYAMPSYSGSFYAIDSAAFRDGIPQWNTDVVLGASSGGFEVAEGSALQEEFKLAGEEAMRLRAYPSVYHYPVGRYDIVFDGRATASLLGSTVVPALSLDRVLGLTRQAEGDSFLQPIGAIMGAQTFSPKLNLVADRRTPSVGAAKWDDEGVATKSFPLVTNGKVTGLFATRASASMVPDAVKSALGGTLLTGSAITGLPTRGPTGGPSTVYMTPGNGGDSAEALAADMESGVLVMGSLSASVEPSLGYGMAVPNQCFEIKKGKITRNILSAGIQFSTQRMWRSLEKVGSEKSVRSSLEYTQIGAPATAASIHMYTPATLLRGVSLIDLEASRS